jgi:hypothetical protein
MLNKCNKCSSPYQTKYSYSLSSYETNNNNLTNQRIVSIVLLDDQTFELNVDVILSLFNNNIILYKNFFIIFYLFSQNVQLMIYSKKFAFIWI